MGDKPWAVGIDLGGTKVEVACVDLEGTILKRHKFATNADRGPQQVQAAIVSGVRQLLNEVGSAPEGIGIGVAGQIDHKSGTVLFGPNLGWHNVPLKSTLEKELNLPTFVTNDVRAATWAEWLFGAGAGVEDLLCLFIGTGIGGGVILENTMIYGCGSTAGEVGHTTVDLNGPLCKCGRQGCLEAFAGGAALQRHAQEAMEADPEAGGGIRAHAAGASVTMQHIVDAYRKGDPLAQELIHKAKDALVAGVANLINAFNPCVLVVGGGVVKGLPEILDWLRHGVPEQALKAACAQLQIVPATYGNDAGVVGAASIALRT